MSRRAGGVGDETHEAGRPSRLGGQRGFGEQGEASRHAVPTKRVCMSRKEEHNEAIKQKSASAVHTLRPPRCVWVPSVDTEDERPLPEPNDSKPDESERGETGLPDAPPCGAEERASSRGRRRPDDGAHAAQQAGLRPPPVSPRPLRRGLGRPAAGLAGPRRAARVGFPALALGLAACERGGGGPPAGGAVARRAKLHGRRRPRWVICGAEIR